jgi:hypothetical protein
VTRSSLTALASTPSLTKTSSTRTTIRSGIEDLDDGLFMIVGPSRAGGMLEIGVVTGSEAPVIVHAMQARPKYLR